MSEIKKIVIVDDHAMFRKGLSMLIALFPGCTVLFDAANGKDFLDKDFLKLADLNPHEALKLVSQLLCDFYRYKYFNEDSNYEDASYVSRPEVEVEEERIGYMQIENALISAILRCSEKIIKEKPEELEKIVTCLEGNKWTIFRRNKFQYEFKLIYQFKN